VSYKTQRRQIAPRTTKFDDSGDKVLPSADAGATISLPQAERAHTDGRLTDDAGTRSIFNSVPGSGNAGRAQRLSSPCDAVRDGSHSPQAEQAHSGQPSFRTQRATRSRPDDGTAVRSPATNDDSELLRALYRWGKSRGYQPTIRGTRISMARKRGKA